MRLTFGAATEPLKVGSVRGKERLYPATPAGRFRCSDELLNRIWEAGARTLSLCMHDAYVDCPTREQRQWVADASLEALVNYAVFGDAALAARFLRQVAQAQRSDGRTPMCAPGDFSAADFLSIADFTLAWILAIAVLSIYFLAGLPQIKLFTYRLMPHSRRPRAILIGDEIFAKVGGYMLGSFITAVIAGLGTYLWLLAWGVPYPLLLGTFVAFLDLIPVIGSTVGGIVVSLVALTVSLPVALGTLGFYVFYRLAEDYLIVPRIQGRTVELPALASLVAVLIGGVLLGIVGVLVAIPVAAAIRLLLQEVAFPRLDKS